MNKKKVRYLLYREFHNQSLEVNSYSATGINRGFPSELCFVSFDDYSLICRRNYIDFQNMFTYYKINYTECIFDTYGEGIIDGRLCYWSR